MILKVFELPSLKTPDMNTKSGMRAVHSGKILRDKLDEHVLPRQSAA